MWKIRKYTIRDENVPIRVNLQSIVFQYCAYGDFIIGFGTSNDTKMDSDFSTEGP